MALQEIKFEEEYYTNETFTGKTIKLKELIMN